MDGSRVRDLNEEVREEILKTYPDLQEDDIVDSQEILKARLSLMERRILSESDWAREIDEDIIRSIQEHSFITVASDEELTFSQKAADVIARFGGSWTFILTFLGIVIFWIVLNTIILLNNAYDPYPFILLNLGLSLIAAIQAPIIMMSQNRLEKRDREQAMSNYQVDLKSEIEVRLLHEKMNHLIFEQMFRLLELQEIQIEMLKELKNNDKKEPK